jgi:hypothetical protein
MSFAAVLASATFAGAAETKNAVEPHEVAAAAAAVAPITISQIFAEAAEDLEIMSGPHGFAISRVPVPEVVVIRIEKDGTRTKACVDSERAARAFLGGTGKQTKAEKE